MKHTHISLIIMVALFVSMTAVITAFQIPVFPPFFNLDFSLVIIIIAFYTFGFRFSLIVSVLSPWLALPLMTFPDVIGTLFLMIMNLTMICSLALLNKTKLKEDNDKNNILKIFLIILITPLFLGIINMFIIYPMYGWDFLSSETLNTIWGVGLLFTVIKLVATQIIAFIILRAYGESLKTFKSNLEIKW